MVLNLYIKDVRSKRQYQYCAGDMYTSIHATKPHTYTLTDTHTGHAYYTQ